MPSRISFLVIALFPLIVHAQKVEDQDRKEFLIQTPTRLHDWLLSSEGSNRLPYDVALSWISSTQRQPDIDRSEKLLAYLTERSLMAAGDPLGASRLRALVQALPYRGRIALPSTDARWLEANQDADPILLPGDRLVSYRRPLTVSVVLSSGKVCNIAHRAGQPALAYAMACLGDTEEQSRLLSRIRDSSRIWIGQPDGQVFTAFLDLTQDFLSPEPAPGAWIWVPQGWAEQEEWFSLALAELLAAQGPAGNYVRSLAEPEVQPVIRKKPVPITRSQFGSVGLIQMPSARMSPEGTLSVSRTFSEPYRRINIQMQALPWLEYGLRYTDIRNRLYGPASFSGDQTYIDKSLDLKFRLIEETDYRPQIAIGMIDAVGTGLFSSEYIVASKRFGDFDVSGGLAFGVIGAGGNVSNPLGVFTDRFKNRRRSDVGQGGKPAVTTWFTGQASPFFGVQWLTPWPNWIAKVEYSANDGSLEPYLSGTIRSIQPQRSRVNAALVYQMNDWVDFSFGLERGYQFIAGLNLHTSLNKKPLPKILDRPLPVITPQPVQGSPPLNSRSAESMTDNRQPDWRGISVEIERVSLWRVETIERQNTELIVRFLSTPGVYAQDRIERVGRILHQMSPPDIDRFTIHL
ncbi:MAG: hypothetical protein EBR85_09445, partial [Betaproteobacteria bacterium]|nr:hypothetical protein [Betaproteobacteria bacterium]